MFNKTLILILAIGIIIRLFLSAITFHPDITAFDLGGQLVAKGNVLNLYDYISKLPSTSPLLKNYPPDFLIYPPAIYLYQGLFAAMFNNFFDPGFLMSVLVEVPKTFNTWTLSWHLVFLKLPYLLFDIPIAFLLAKLFESKREKILAFTFWIFNPVNLYATYMMGQFDIIPTFFVILSLYFLRRSQMKEKNIIFALIALGVGAAFKIYPLFLIIPLAFIGRTFWDKIKYLLIGVLPYFLFILPFIFSHGFRSSALVAGQTLKSFYAQIPISGGESIILFPFILIFFYLYIYLNNKLLNNFENVWKIDFIILILFFIFTHYHPQWFLWLTPFLIIALIKSNNKIVLPFVLSLISFFGLLFFFDSSLTIGIFSPIISSLYQSPTAWEIFRINIDTSFARSILQTLFVSCGAIFIYFFFPKVDENG